MSPKKITALLSLCLQASFAFANGVFGFMSPSPAVYLFVLIMGIPAYFLSHFAFKKLIENEQKRQVFTWISTIVLAPIFYVIGVMTFFAILFYEPTYDFDKEDWDADIENRWRMAVDIEKSKMLIGKDSIEVKSLIGDTSHKWIKEDGTPQWYYDLGSSVCGFSVCFHSIYIVFQNGKVIEAKYGFGQD